MNFLCFDTEDNSKELLEAGKSGFDKQITQIAMITAKGDKYYNKGDVDAFKKHLKLCKERFFYAHNLQYDLGNLFGKKLDDLDVTMVGGRIIKAVWGNKVFVDSFNIWPMSAKKLGDAFGLKKLETDSMSTDKEYVFRDVEIIRQAMLFAWAFCEGLGIKNLPPTLGGLCVKVWRHFGGANQHDSAVLSRESLYGGRVELFSICDDVTWKLNDKKLIYAAFHNDDVFDKDGEPIDWIDLMNFGQGKIAYTDLNSLYPHVMCGKFPTALEEWTASDLPEYGIVKCSVQQPETDITILPYRNAEGRILYPCGKFSGCWTVAELNEFCRLGGKILKVFECMGTNESDNPYKAFVENLYRARLGSESEAEKLFFKLLMNNLYGRLGTSGMIGRSVWQTDQNKYEGIPYGEKVLVNYQMPLSEETNWSHASYVTSYGRLELLKYLRLIGWRALIYCDTDSAVFNCPTKQIPFAIGKELGQMKLESFENAAIAFAPKTYRLGDHYKAKGVPKNKAEQFIKQGHAEFDLPFKLREAMRFYDRNNSKRLSVWRPVQKLRQTIYDRKRLKDNKFFPCNVNDLSLVCEQSRQ